MFLITQSALLLPAAVGLGLAAGAFSLWLGRFLNGYSWQKRLADLIPSETFNSWVELTDKRLQKADSRLRGFYYTLGVMAAVAVSLYVGLFVFRNLVAAALMVTVAILLPDQLILQRFQTRRQKMMEQMAAAVRIFAAEYIHTPQIPRAIGEVAARVPNPIGGIFLNAYRALNAGCNPDRVLADMMASLDFEQGRMFVQLLKIARHDASIAPLFGELVTRLAVQMEMVRKNKAELYGERFLSWILVVSPLPIYLFMRRLVPETTFFLTQTVFGRLVIVVAFLSVIIWIIMDRLIGRVES